ncbi:MAG: AMP-binding protein [Burkholderiaceae bacterium]|nr:AMP-binding protein [Rhodoferax sp.]MCB2029961.1 AMP-binding protein [Rhodoferax sp.]MCB2041647.1 AMP-binding protein [Rhodoferax sp.]MCP5264209.1 AMP-binding protein [Rhodoferax sp.]
MRWILGDMLDAVATVVPPERQAIVQGDVSIAWGDFDQRTNRLARAFLAAGLRSGDRVGFLMRNKPAYVEAFIGCLKARLSPANINYRYTADEVAYILRNSGARCVIFQKEFARDIALLQETLPEVVLWICEDGEHRNAQRFEALASQGNGAPLDIQRAPEDAFLMYTGGTTGRPKGVIWPGHTVREVQLESPLVTWRPENMAQYLESVRTTTAPGRVIPACPLMHAAGITSTLSELLAGGTVVLLPSTTFDAKELWQVAAREQATRLLIVGDVFARPMARVLDEARKPFALDALKVISSSGLMWSIENKRQLLRHLPQLKLVDLYGASEASGLGYSVTTADTEMPTGRFQPGPRTVLITSSGEILGPDQPGEGMIARPEPIPQGYFGDPVKTRETFQVHGGQRYAVPGDWARRHEDGSMELIGRGNLVINTGGEKVFVEEVEQAVKQLDGIDDAMVIGVPDASFGHIVVALTRMRNDITLDEFTLRQALRGKLAGYKIPKRIFAVDGMPRSESGKGNYQQARQMADSLLARH